jgi:hypothetical protein
MSVTLYIGQTLTKKDLNIFIYDTDGVTFFNPFSITYTIYHIEDDQFHIQSYAELPNKPTNSNASFNALYDPPLYNQEDGEQPILETIDCIPIPFGLGKFFAPWKMSHDTLVGEYRIKWHVRKYSDSPIIQEVEEFQIITKKDVLNFSQMNGGPTSNSKKLPNDMFGNQNLSAG